MTRLQRYYQKIKTEVWQADSAQETTVQALQAIYEALVLKKNGPPGVNVNYAKAFICGEKSVAGRHS